MGKEELKYNISMNELHKFLENTSFTYSEVNKFIEEWEQMGNDNIDHYILSKPRMLCVAIYSGDIISRNLLYSGIIHSKSELKDLIETLKNR